MLQYIGNKHQLAEVDAFAVKHLVDVRLLAINLLGKPFDGSPLMFQLFFDHDTHMDVFHGKRHNAAVLV